MPDSLALSAHHKTAILATLIANTALVPAQRAALVWFSQALWRAWDATSAHLTVEACPQQGALLHAAYGDPHTPTLFPAPALQASALLDGLCTLHGLERSDWRHLRVFPTRVAQSLGGRPSTGMWLGQNGTTPRLFFPLHAA